MSENTVSIEERAAHLKAQLADLEREKKELERQKQLAEQAAREAAAKKAAEDAAAKRRALQVDALTRIAQTIRARNATLYKDAPIAADVVDGELRLDGKGVWNLEFVTEYRSEGRWHSTPTGRLRIRVGDYGDRTTFPPLKAGGYNYEKIADEVVREHRRHQLRDQARRNENANMTTAHALKERLGYSKWDSIYEASQDANRPVRFKRSLQADLTVEQAEKVDALLKQIDAVIKGK